VRAPWMTDTGVIARKLSVPDASRRVSLVWRRSFPRAAALEVITSTILAKLPNTVIKLG